MGRERSLVFAVLAVVTAAVLLWAGIEAATTPAGECDNMAGECLRGRQTAALYLLAACCVAGAAAALWCGVALVRRGWSRGRGGVIGLAAVLALVVVVVAPAGHLDDRFDGWLADGEDAVAAQAVESHIISSYT